jgi:regulatory protein
VLGSRALSEHELEERLARKGIVGEAWEEARDTLRAAGYVDDARFAAGRATVLAGRDSGDALIRDDLERRGLDREAIDQALAGLEPEPERARAAVERDGPEILRKLATRGFSPDVLEELHAVASADGDLVN